MAQIENIADSGLPPGPGSGGRSRDAVDPELLELPAPPRGRRLLTLGSMALVVVASVLLAASLRDDVAYFFAPSETTDLGDVRQIDPATLVPNSYVRVRGTPMMSRAVRYRRVLTGAQYVVFPLAGQRTVYVQVPDRDEALGRTEVSGRLVTFRQLGGRMSTVAGYMRDELGLPVSGESFLILADETPGSYGWALFLVALCALFIAVDLWLLLRWFRPLPDEGASDRDG